MLLKNVTNKIKSIVKTKYTVKEDNKIVFTTYSDFELDKYIYEKYDIIADDFITEDGSGYLCGKGVYLEIIEQFEVI